MKTKEDIVLHIEIGVLVILAVGLGWITTRYDDFERQNATLPLCVVVLLFGFGTSIVMTFVRNRFYLQKNPDEEIRNPFKGPVRNAEVSWLYIGSFFLIIGASSIISHMIVGKNYWLGGAVISSGGLGCLIGAFVMKQKKE